MGSTIPRIRHTGWWHNYYECDNLESVHVSVLICRKCLNIVFMPLLETELQQFMDHWNTHCIRRNRLATCPCGIPKDMYDMPQHFGKTNALEDNIVALNMPFPHLQPVDQQLWTQYSSIAVQMLTRRSCSIQCHMLVCSITGWTSTGMSQLIIALFCIDFLWRMCKYHLEYKKMKWGNLYN